METIVKGTLSDDDLDVLSGMMIIFFRAAEKCVSVMENHYALEYMAGEQYNQLCKKVGKVRANMIVKEQVVNIVRGDERNKLGKVLRQFDALHKTLEPLLDRGMTHHSEDVTDVESFDAMANDTNYLVYLYALMANCDQKDDDVKLLSIVRNMGKGHRASENLLEKLRNV